MCLSVKSRRRGENQFITFLVKNIPGRKNSNTEALCSRSRGGAGQEEWKKRSERQRDRWEEGHVGPYIVIRILVFTQGDEPLAGFEQRSSMNPLSFCSEEKIVEGLGQKQLGGY